MNLAPVNNCPVCDNSALKTYKKATFNIHSLEKDDVKITDSAYGKIWDLSQCRNCSHIFAHPCPTPQYMQSLYEEIEDPLYQEESQGRGKNFTRILACLEKIHPQKGTLFDVGAATGILLDLARSRGWQPYGIEPSSWAVQTAQQIYGLNLLEGSFETAQISNQPYTVVTMIDFIEHIPNPRAAIAKAHEILAEDGTLCLVTPDILSVAAKLASKKWWHFRPAHLSYFTRKSLIKLLTIQGFKIFKMRKYAWTFSLHYVISRVSGLNFFLKNRHIASFCRKISIKLALGDSFEVYARK